MDTSPSQRKSQLVEDLRGLFVRLERGVVCAAFLAIAASNADAAVHTVTDLNSSGAGSLSGVLAAAASDPDAVVINFAPGLSGTIILDSALLVIGQTVDIEGPSVGGGIVLECADNVFDLEGATAKIANLTLQNTGGDDVIEAQGTALELDSVLVTGGYHGLSVDGTKSPASLSILRSTFSKNSAAGAPGGGVYVAGASSVLILDSIFDSNRATQGGGLDIEDSTGVDVERTTFLRNTATGSGGGVNMIGSSGKFVSATMTDNEASDGGGLFVAEPTPGAVTLTNLTIVNNLGDNGAGGLSTDQSGAGTVDSCIIAGNSSPSTPADDDISFTAKSPPFVFSLIQTSAGLDASNISGDPQLGPLGDNGGYTQTTAPMLGSPVINAGDPAITSTGADQRGAARVANHIVDIGAVETVLNQLSAMSTEPAGANCPAGGVRIDTGLDSNGDGVLEANEIQGAPTYVCSGVAGATGTAGQNGANAANGVPGPVGATGATGAAGASGKGCNDTQQTPTAGLLSALGIFLARWRSRRTRIRSLDPLVHDPHD